VVPTHQTSPRLTIGQTQFGEAFVGSGANASHVNTVLGAKGGPVESAWVTALATPRLGHASFVASIQPGMAVKPLTLFVNKAPVEAGSLHSRLTWGAAHAGVAAGVAAAVSAGTVGAEVVDETLLIVAVWVDPAAFDETEVFTNNRDAVALALANGAASLPAVADVLAARQAPSNAYFGCSR
jgi:5,6,7,8-tetrahydromethanopterin hydro-lyase